MFDFNHDGRVTQADVDLAAGQIASKVQGYYSPFLSLGLKVYYGDTASETSMGTRWLNFGLSNSSVQVAVNYLGGRSSLGSEFGRSPQAPDGTNVEGYGETYTKTIAQTLLAANPNATSNDFATYVASTSAHELGHMMGLRHSTSGPTNNLMNSGRTRGSDYIVNGAVNTDNGYRQDAYAELTRSFKGERTISGSANYGVRDTLAPQGRSASRQAGDLTDPVNAPAPVALTLPAAPVTSPTQAPTVVIQKTTTPITTREKEQTPTTGSTAKGAKPAESGAMAALDAFFTSPVGRG